MNAAPDSGRLLAIIAAFDCVILRGLPGSGKSSLARRLAQEHAHLWLEADQHFMQTGRYQFDPARVADAHALVTREALTALQAGRRVVVANTHVKLWEMAALLGAVQLAGRMHCFVHCTGRWDNTHAVPEAVIDAMRKHWETLPAGFERLSFRWPA